MKRPLFLALILALPACERATTDPSLASDFAAAVKGKSNTLPALLGEALLVTQREQGIDAAAALLTGWEARQADVRVTHTTGDRAAVQMKVQALRNEEIRIVLKVFGSEIVPRVIRESYLSLAQAEARIQEAANGGQVNAQTRASAEQVRTLLDRATTLTGRDPERALAIATQAADQLAAIDDIITHLRRVRGIETLFPLAAQNLTPGELAKHSELQRAAALALGSASRAEANARLAAVRAEEIRIILSTLGDQTTTDLLREANAALRDVGLKLGLMKKHGQDVLRLERMLKSATDFYNHARVAAQNGDHVTALDHGSHAAGLLNSLRHLMAR